MCVRRRGDGATLAQGLSGKDTTDRVARHASSFNSNEHGGYIRSWILCSAVKERERERKGQVWLDVGMWQKCGEMQEIC